MNEYFSFSNNGLDCGSHSKTFKATLYFHKSLFLFKNGIILLNQFKLDQQQKYFRLKKNKLIKSMTQTGLDSFAKDSVMIADDDDQ